MKKLLTILLSLILISASAQDTGSVKLTIKNLTAHTLKSVRIRANTRAEWVELGDLEGTQSSEPKKYGWQDFGGTVRGMVQFQIDSAPQWYSGTFTKSTTDRSINIILKKENLPRMPNGVDLGSDSSAIDASGAKKGKPGYFTIRNGSYPLNTVVLTKKEGEKVGDKQWNGWETDCQFLGATGHYAIVCQIHTGPNDQTDEIRFCGGIAGAGLGAMSGTFWTQQSKDDLLNLPPSYFVFGSYLFYMELFAPPGADGAQETYFKAGGVGIGGGTGTDGTYYSYGSSCPATK